MIKAILFDFDGVIVESLDIKTEAFKQLFLKEGLAMTQKIVKYHLDHGGVSRYDKFRHIYKVILRRRLSRKEFIRLCCEFSLLVKEAVVNSSYVKGASEFLRHNNRRYRFFLLSGTPHKELREILKIRKLSYLFKSVYGSPHKKEVAVRSIMIRDKLAPSELVYIGDALTDYRAAKNNKIRFIARVNNNSEIFKKIRCRKIKDLTGLRLLLSKL